MQKERVAIVRYCKRAQYVSTEFILHNKEKKEIDNLTLQRIADILNVPISDLLSDEPVPDYNRADIKFYNRKYTPYTLQIGKICKIKGITPQTLHSTLKNNPTVLSLQKIADVIGCEMADFFPPSSKSTHSPELICHTVIGGLF